MKKLKQTLHAQSNSQKAAFLSRYFKTGKGEYGEGDVFIGLTVPQQRIIAKQFSHLSLGDIRVFLKSKIHEFRFTALEILVMKYEKANTSEKKKIHEFYLDNTQYINNWDLVDTSAPYIVGGYLADKDKQTLFELARSKNLWERRIAIVATLAFIQNNQFENTFKIAKVLLEDKHDLIHKAVGWMLREVGKKDEKALEDFLKKHYEKIPRTTLRYAIERFNNKKRLDFLKRKL